MDKSREVLVRFYISPHAGKLGPQKLLVAMLTQRPVEAEMRTRLA
jgi:hypothetical protein